MTENAKTGIFASAAAVIGLIAFYTMPQQAASIKDNTQQLVGKPMFENFTDPNSAATLKIVKFDDTLGQLKQFELSREKATGAWVIPSHDSYPADAASQVSNVANSFIGLRILTVESTKADDQKLFGVVEPDIAKLEVGDTGVGTLIEMKDDRGETLVSLIVGKTVRDDKKKRYVRRARTDAIYAADFDIEPVTTDFSKWIEGDLLKLTSNDIASLSIRDYNILQAAGGPGQLQKNFDADLEYSPLDAKWSAKSVRVYGQGGPSERKIEDDEELNLVKINEIKNTLDNLKIVDVVRKPKGLASDLKADKELLDDNTKIMSLFKKGFIPGQRSDGGMELYSTNGELAVKLNDGIEYLLRFGKATAGDSSDEDGEKESAAGVALNRTLFVTARLDESHYPMPTLQKVPETIEDLKELEAKQNPPEEKAPASEPTTPEPAPSVPDAKSTDDAKAKNDAKTEDAPKETTGSDSKAPSSEVKADDVKKNAPSPTEEPAKTTEPAKVPENVPGTEPAKSADVPSETPAPNKVDQSNLEERKIGTRLVRLQADEGAKASSSESTPGKDDTDSKPKNDEKKSKQAKKKSEGKSEKKNDPAKEKSATAEKPASDSDKKAPTESNNDSAKTNAKSEAEAAKPAVKDDKKPDPTSEPKDAKKPAVETQEELKERLEAARERITKENTREIDERNDRLNAAKKKAGELNARFAEWYYEISDSEFKRLRATLDDLIKKKAAPGSAPAGPPSGAQGFPGGSPF